MSKIVHFEVPAGGHGPGEGVLECAVRRRVPAYDGPTEYHMFQNDDQTGGAVYQQQEGEKGLITYFNVDDIDSAKAKVEELGGKTEDKHPSRAWAGSPGPRHRGQRLLALAGRRERAHGRPAGLEQPRRIEQFELGLASAENRLRDQLAARETEHVPVARIAAGDPDAFVVGHRADQG